MNKYEVSMTVTLAVHNELAVKLTALAYALADGSDLVEDRPDALYELLTDPVAALSLLVDPARSIDFLPGAEITGSIVHSHEVTAGSDQ